MEKAFNSARLVYRALEHDSPEDDNLLLTISRDIDGFANSNASVLKPQNRKSAEKWKEHLLNGTLITTVFCIPSAPSSSDLTPIGVMSLSAETSCPQHRHARVTIDVIPSHQRMGYGSEAITWLLNWGFQLSGLHRIAVENFSYNEGAGRLYEKLGFKLEGRRRDFVWFNGGWHDLLCFAILEDEWRESEKSKGREL